METKTEEDILMRLRRDAGTQTFGQLVQEREWAYQEILQLRKLVERSASPSLSARARRAAEQCPTGDMRTPIYIGIQYIRIREVCARVGLRPSTVYQLIKTGRFPKQVKLSERTAAWIESEVESFMDARLIERDRKLASNEPNTSMYMRMGDVMKHTGLKSSEIYELVRAGRFPKWAKLPKIASGWIKEEVDAWVLARNNKGNHSRDR